MDESLLSPSRKGGSTKSKGGKLLSKPSGEFMVEECFCSNSFSVTWVVFYIVFFVVSLLWTSRMCYESCAQCVYIKNKCTIWDSAQLRVALVK